MRLTCPNCGAQYEVPDAVIPAAGRDVQCSNCGDTWFQAHPDAAGDQALPPVPPVPPSHVAPRRPRSSPPAERPDSGALDAEGRHFEGTTPYDDAPEAPVAAPADPGSEPMGWPEEPADPRAPLDPPLAEDEPEAYADAAKDTDAPDPDVFADDAPAGTTAEDTPEAPFQEDPDTVADRPLPRPFEDEDYDDYDDEGPAPAELLANRRRRELDPSVRDVLREEAQHEAQARAQESGGLESQPELGLSDPESETDRREREARARMARLRGKPVPADPRAEDQAEAETQAASRRDLLPDIEEINSSLRSRNQKVEADADYEEEDPAVRRSFRRGFALPIFLAAIGVLVYVNAPRIALRFPQAAPAMRAYVGGVNDARLWLDSNTRELIAWIETKTGGEG